MNPGSRQRPAVDGGEDGAGEDVAGTDLVAARRRAAAEGAGAVVERRRATGCRGRGLEAACGESGEGENGGAREQPHATWSSK